MNTHLECIKSWSPDGQVVVMEGDLIEIYNEKILINSLNDPIKYFDIIIEEGVFNKGHELRISSFELVKYFGRVRIF